MDQRLHIPAESGITDLGAHKKTFCILAEFGGNADRQQTIVMPGQDFHPADALGDGLREGTRLNNVAAAVDIGEHGSISDNVLIIEKMPLFQSWGVLPTSVAMVPTFVFTSVNMVSKFDVTHPVRSSFMKSVIFSIIPPINYPNRVASCGIRFIPISTMPPPAINCLIPCDFAYV